MELSRPLAAVEALGDILKQCFSKKNVGKKVRFPATCRVVLEDKLHQQQQHRVFHNMLREHIDMPRHSSAVGRRLFCRKAPVNSSGSPNLGHMKLTEARGEKSMSHKTGERLEGL